VECKKEFRKREGIWAAGFEKLKDWDCGLDDGGRRIKRFNPG
jgi:hypothetical protein